MADSSHHDQSIESIDSSDKDYEVTKDDLEETEDTEDDSNDEVEEKTRNAQKRKKGATGTSVRAKRTCTENRIERFGQTDKSIDHNSFFENLSTSTEDGLDSIEISSENNDISCTKNPNAALNDNQLLRLCVLKIDAMRKQLISLEVKIDNVRDNGTKDAGKVGMLDIDNLTKLGLPAKNKIELESLETNLKDESKRKEIFNVLTKFGGTRGNSNGSKILEQIVHALIEPVFLPSISWSGRGRGKEEKIPLSKFINTVNLIAVVLEKADAHFDRLETIKCLKYKIIKYAPAKYGVKGSCVSKEGNNTVSEKDSSSQMSSGSSEEHSSNITRPPSCNIPATTQNLTHNLNSAPNTRPPIGNIPTTVQYLNHNPNQVFGLQAAVPQQMPWPYQNVHYNEKMYDYMRFQQTHN